MFGIEPVFDVQSINSIMQQYRNTDGTYTSPKNGKTYKSLKAFISHWNYRGTTNPDSFKERLATIGCKFCNKPVLICSIKKHETSCYLSPDNLVKCKVCDAPIKDYLHSKGTCSRSCANKYFRSGEDNGNWSGGHYQTLCFSKHKKECVVCKEAKIVAVHHFNEDHSDDSIENLIPLCPTHHMYMHSKFKIEILHIVEEYVRQFKLGFA